VYKYLCIFTALVFISGCASSIANNKKYRDGNQVISGAFPSATFTIEEGFVFYDAEQQFVKVNTNATATSSSNYKSEQFIFIKPLGNVVKNIAVIQFDRMMKNGWKWARGAQWTGSGVVYGSQKTEIGEMETWAVFTSTEEAMGYIGTEISDFAIEPCVIAVTARLIPQGMAYYKHLVHYFEPIDCSDFNYLMYSGGELTNTGRLRLDRTLRDAFSKILIESD